MTTLAGVNPNSLDDRAAMGLPDHLVERITPDTFARHSDLLGRPAEPLVAVLGDRTAPVSRRYVAGSMLAMIGDPRIDPATPAMVTLPAAVVEIGLPPDEVDEVVARWRHAGVRRDWITKECPAHSVPLAEFRIARWPVTNLEYREFLADTGHDGFPSSWRFGGYPHLRANHPVWTVRPSDAERYAHWLSARTGRSFRLPTEAEWEYAAHGGSTAVYPWGAEFDPQAANTVEAGPLTTTPVGMYPAGRSVAGVDDLAGNVEEFVADDYRPYPGGAAVADDLTAGGDSYRVARGGSFTRFGDLARCRRRHGWFDRAIYAIGFRLAETP
ncbi:MAG TPA: SUMF1/EgtB/PvdO family nonheme iron enzyme [Pseudonocardiaceae bacterium]|jgi:formylglycine-generating enzyme required for sulfatase activity|nr:SUMF1/EgtB/PvdO family nonheme iron enzyme [Pseudonocardiaceae bacterium]